MSIAGNLKTMQLAELLQWLAQSNKTGTLVIDDGQVEKKIFFSRGKIISSSSSAPKEYLGHFLVSHGFINEEELAQAMEMQSTNKMLLGKILLTIGVLSERDLEQMLRLKAEESIYDIFSWDEGEFRFLDDELPEHEMVPVSLDVTSIVFNGLQRLDEWGRIRERIPSPRCVPVAVEELEAPEGASGAQAVLDLVDDDRTVEEIALQTHSGEFHVCRILFDQVERGKLKMVRPRALGSENHDSDRTGVVRATSLLDRAEDLLREKSLESALRHLRAARSLEPDSKKVQSLVQQGEQRIRSEIEADGVLLSAVPRLSPEVEDLSSLDISPEEGFIVSRINGSYDIRTIVKISPMAPLDAQLVFWKLSRAGYIQLGETGGG